MLNLYRRGAPGCRNTTVDAYMREENDFNTLQRVGCVGEERRMTGRLIEAENVKVKMRCPNCHSQCFWCNVDACCELIDSVPTVEAIPVEWLQGVIDMAKRVYADGFAESLELMIEDWREEQRKEE